MHLLRRYWKRFSEYFRKLSLLRKIGVIAASFFTMLGVGFFFLFFLVWMGVFGSLPGRTELSGIRHPVGTEIYSADSVLLGRYYIQERSPIRYDQIPLHLIHALTATEDARFFNHHGIDSRSLLRVLIKTILFGDESSGGGSTITQQLAKNLYPRRNYPIISMVINKMREMIIAWRLEGLYTKEEILTFYLNTVPFGDNTFGIESAAKRFFSVSVENLEITQAAILVGMLKASYYYNPRVFPEHALQRREVVLNQMTKYGYLEPDKRDSLVVSPLSLEYQLKTYHSGLAPYFREYIKKELLSWCEKHFKRDGQPYNLFTDGLKVYTSIDSRLQQYAEQAMARKMIALQKEFDNHWKNRNPWDKHPEVFQYAVRQSERYKTLKENGLSEDEILAEMKKPLLMTVFSWDGEKELTMSPLDSIGYYLKFLNAGFLAMNPYSGDVLAWVGGIDHQYFPFDHVKESTKRQVGSTFKPIVYAAALENGMNPCQYTSAEKVLYTNMEGWLPENGEEENYDRKYSLEGGLTYSVNTVSVRVAENAGLNNTVDLAKRMGIKSEVPAVPSIALGTPSISITEMVSAYSSFVNQGKSVKPFYIHSITTHQDSLLHRFDRPESSQVLSEANARLIIQMLKGVVNEGTASSLRFKYGITGDVAGKTGTTQSNADGWFIALLPEMVVGSWVGADNPGIRFRTTALGQGAHTALPVFADFYQQMSQDKKSQYWVNTTFPALTDKMKRRLDCDLYKSDLNLVEKIFGKKEKIEEQEFGKSDKKKDGFFKRLFKKS